VRVLRPPNSFGGRREEALQQFRDCDDAILAKPEPRIFEIGRMAQRLALDAVLVDPDEVQVVGENDVL